MSLIVEIEKRLGNFFLQTQFETSGGTMALLGASGCGKSVTLKCIAGIMTPDKGRIILNGHTLFDSKKQINLPPQKRQVGYLFQQYALFPNMTVAQNLLCGIRSGTKEEKKQQVTEHLRRFQLNGFEKKYPAQLSGGQQQRAALARILVSEPRAILLDEPFSALDSFLKWKLELELSDLLSDFQGPILWVSHDLGECYRNCQTVCVMEQGRSGAMTDMDTLIRQPASKGAARLIGCRNFIPGRQEADGIHLEGWNLVLPLQQEQKQVTVAIPDQAICLFQGSCRAEVSRIIRDLNHTVLLLPPPGMPNAPILRTTLPEHLTLTPGQEILFHLSAPQCLLYS